MTGSQSGTTASIAHIFCLDARYQSVTTAESARRVDETPNHFARVLLPRYKLSLVLWRYLLYACDCGSTRIDMSLLDQLIISRYFCFLKHNILMIT